MKTNRLVLILVFIIFSSIASAQNLTQDFESGDRTGQAALCWSFPGTSFINSAERISGNWSGRTGQLTSLVSWNGVVSPWMDLSPGDLTFKNKINNTAWTTRLLDVELMSYPDSAITNIYHYTFSPPGTTAIDMTVPVNVSGVYKIYIKYTGTGGTGRAVIDDIVYPGVYYSDPPACTPILPSNDIDGDGVPDNEDDYPSDPTRAYNNYLPSSTGWSTLMFEDLWPATGDYDFNDIVIDYQMNRITNAQNNVVDIIARFALKASGAHYHNGFGFQFNGLPNEKVISVTGSDLSAPGLITLLPNGMEAGQTTATIIVFDDAYRVLGYPGTGTGINTEPGIPLVPYDTISIVMTLIQNGVPAPGGTTTLAEVDLTTFNPFTIIDQERGKEVHLQDMPPTALVNTGYFGQAQDDSDPGLGRYYKTENNLPWGLQIIESIPYMKERNDIATGYLHLIEWATSNGASYPDWYKDLPGYRDMDHIY